MVISDQIFHFFNILRHKISILTQYHLIPSSTKLSWPNTTKHQSVPLHTDPVPSCINQFRSILTHYHQEPTSTAPYWPNTTKYQLVLPFTDPVPSCINQYRPILTQYHQISTSTAFYWPSTIIFHIQMSDYPCPPVDLRWAQLYDSLVLTTTTN